MDLEVHIEMMDLASLITEIGGDFSSHPQTEISFTSTIYDGATYYFESVLAGSSLAALKFGDSSGTEVSVDAYWPTTIKRVRSDSFSPDTGNKRIWCTSNVYEITVYVARLIIVQSNATKTELQIAIGTSASGKYSAYANPSNWGQAKRKGWYYDSSKFSTSGAITVEMEAVLACTKGYTAYGCIKEWGGTTAITNGEASFLDSAGGVITRIRNTDGITLSNGTTYEGDFKCSNSKTTYVYAVRLIIRLAATISKVETVQRCGWEQSGVNVCDECRTLFTEGFSGTPTVLFESTGYETATDVGNDIELEDDGLNDSGIAGTTVTDSGVNYNSTTPVVKRSIAINLTDGNRYYAKGLEADSFWGNAWLIIQAIAAISGWRKLQYFTEPRTTGAWNKLKYAAEPPVPAAFNKLLYEGE